MQKRQRISILMVCMGNICRSPTAEAVVRKRIHESGLHEHVLIDSAGTHAYHVGASPDRRAREAAAQRGYDMSALVGRQVSDQDFVQFDYILAMDAENLGNLKRRCPPSHQHKLRLLMSFSQVYPGQEVPDPYYGGRQGFDLVLDMIEDATLGLISELRREITQAVRYPG